MNTSLKVGDAKGKYYPVTYEDKDGDIVSVQLPRVTHILDYVLAKPKLLYWYYKTAVAGMASLAQRFNGKLPVSPDGIHALLSRYDLTPFKIRNNAADSGTDQHTRINDFLTGKREQSDVPGFELWWKARDLSLSDIVATEVGLASLSGGYAGRVDCIYREPSTGKVVLTDWKTGKYVHYPALVQTRAYKRAWEEMGGEPIDHVSMVHIPATGGYQELTTDADLDTVWEAILTIYNVLPPDWAPEEITFEGG